MQGQSFDSRIAIKVDMLPDTDPPQLAYSVKKLTSSTKQRNNFAYESSQSNLNVL